MSTELRELQRTRPTVLRNVTCAYCACILDKSNSTKACPESTDTRNLFGRNKNVNLHGLAFSLQDY